MRKYVIRVSGGPDIEFEGEILAEDGNTDPIVTLYRTKAGKIITCHNTCHNTFSLRDTGSTYTVHDNVNDALNRLGYSEVAKRLARTLGINRNKVIP